MTAERTETQPAQFLEIEIEPGLSLRKVTPQDSEVMFVLIDKNTAHLSQFGDNTAEKYPTLESVRQRNTHEFPNEHRFGIWDQGIFVGFVKVTKGSSEMFEIGYWQGEEFCGKGYMTKAVIALTQYAVDSLGAKVLFGRVAKENAASIKVLERADYVSSEETQNNKYFIFKSK